MNILYLRPIKSPLMPATLTYSPLIPQNPAAQFGILNSEFGITAPHFVIPQPTPNSSLLTPNWTFTFSAKEKDVETGLSYFGSRYYSSDLSIWLSVDPMSDKYASLSPYVYCADNPVILVDPNGEEINPIYDRLGYFLGTDDRGLQGDYIVMERTNFQQNMSHDDALKNSTYFDMYHYSEAKTRCLEHFNSLKDRPDYDGFVTISEGIQWAKDHPNAKNHPNPYNTLYIDAAQLDLGFLTVENSGLKVGDDYVYVNLYDFVNRKSPRSVNTTYALGNTGIKLLDNKGTISFSGDVYDWDYHKKSPMRNSLIFLERLRTGLDDSHGFKVCIYGTAKLNQTWPY
jgi:RHS repeat-associated protein